MRFSTDIRLSPSTNICNDEIALVDILLCYHGENRNGSRMSKETMNKAIPTLYGIPIIGEYIYLDDGSQDFGSHGGKITISDKGIKFESTTIPYGFVTKEAVDNAEWVTVTEKDGHTQHEYLSLKGCAVWYKRMPEVSSILEKNYGQSMEIKINDYSYNDNGIMDITDFTFTGACILGSNPNGEEVEPCYESACIGRHYELDAIKNDIKEMMNAYNKFQIKKKEENSMDFSKVTEALAQYTFKNADDTDIAKYALLTVGETSVGVLDREDYCTYSIDCTEADGAIVFDMDSKVKCAMGVKDYVEGESFDLAGEIESVKEATKESCESKLSASFATEYNAKIDEITKAYAELKSNFDSVSAELETYKKIDTDRKTAEHKAEIDSLIETYAKKIGRLPKFLCYRAKLDYSKETADVERELTVMAGEAMMDKGTANFSYSPVVTPVGKTSAEKYAGSDRYGNLLDKFMND
nr:MAG TPA: hypothetical protein [Caudoviricetes sp.]